MSLESELVLSLPRFREIVLDSFFEGVSPELAEVGKALCQFCWDLDGRCHTQDWEGEKDRVAVFSLPIHLRKSRISKNYAALYRPMPGDENLIFEVIFPSKPEVRERILGAHDVQPDHTHTLGHPRFLLDVNAPLNTFRKLVSEARQAKAKPLSTFMKEAEE